MSANLRTGVRLTAISALGLLAAACEQPAPKCSIARGTFAATYTLDHLVSGSGDCGTLKGEVLNVGAYNPPISSSDRQPDPNRTILAIQPQSLLDLLGGAAGVVEPNMEDKGYALGEFAKSEPGEDDFCVAPSLSAARVRLPEIPESADMCTTTPAQPAVDLQYEWSNVRVYTTAGAYGTQFGATLTYTKDGCSAVYKVYAVSPAVSCAMEVPKSDESHATGDDAGVGGGAADARTPQGMDGSTDMDAAEPNSDAGALADGEVTESDGACPAPEDPGPAPIPDETLCLPYADPAHGRALGSSINPDFAIRCDPDLLLCVLSKEPPSLR